MRQAGATAEIEVTPAMVEAGVEEAREFPLGAPLADLVVAVFSAMFNEVGRLDQKRLEI